MIETVHAPTLPAELKIVREVGRWRTEQHATHKTKSSHPHRPGNEGNELGVLGELHLMHFLEDEPTFKMAPLFSPIAKVAGQPDFWVHGQTIDIKCRQPRWNDMVIGTERDRWDDYYVLGKAWDMDYSGVTLIGWTTPDVIRSFPTKKINYGPPVYMVTGGFQPMGSLLQTLRGRSND